MKAVVVSEFGPVDNAQLADIATPVPGPGEVRVAVRAAELNYPDVLVMQGAYQVKPPLPFTPGKAAAGIIDAVGEGVSGWQVGDRVVVQVEYGAFAEKLIARVTQCYALPDSIPFVDAAALGLVYQTAWFALHDRAMFQAGDRVLVLGASGGIGVASVQLAKALGASCVIAGVLGEHNRHVADRAGADHVIDLGIDDLNKRLREEVHVLTRDKHTTNQPDSDASSDRSPGVDVVIDPVGGEVTTAAMRAMAWRGRLVVIGFASGSIPVIKANYLLVKNISVSGLQWSDYRDRTPELTANAQASLFDLYKKGALHSPVTRTLPLADFVEGLHALQWGEAQGKLVLLMK